MRRNLSAFKDRLRSSALAVVTGLLMASVATPEPFEADVMPLVETSCLICHGDQTVTPLNLKTLGFDLANSETVRAWERVFDRVDGGEMPPFGVALPDTAIVETALGSLKRALVAASLVARDGQRTALRRLTRLEYAYTLQDLLLIDEELGHELSETLPAEADSGGFDTVAAVQGISALHVHSYLDVADRALDAAIQLGPRPPTIRYEIDYPNSSYLNYMHDAKILGGGITKKLDDAVVMFFDVGSTYLMHSESEGFNVPYAGRYRATLAVYPYQADTPVTLTLYRGIKQGVTASLDQLIGTFDLLNDTGRTVEVTTFLRPGELLSPSVSELDVPPGSYVNYFAPENNVRDYQGEGIAIKSLTIEGPLIEMWPPMSTRQLLTGVDFTDDGQIRLSKSPYAHIVDIVARFGSLALRHPLGEEEVEVFASLAKPLLADERGFLEAVRVPLRAILSTPEFLYQAGVPGELDDYRLATRLSYFLWRSMPDAELFDLAREGRLTSPVVLEGQVNRMLDDVRSERFVKDFAGQAYRLYELKATTPDPGLYPEYDDRLGQAMAWETERFLAELIAQDLGVAHLIDADFTFLNRRLAEHYDVPGITGQEMRKVMLPADSSRGGLLTQASIHKITANGTTTSPVPRGNFVLTNLLGKPAPPPPPNVAGLEPDTRGTTTIREQLAAHRVNPTCAGCHRAIDPPGFALESFDPIGGFRNHYRVSGGMMKVGDSAYPLPYKVGLAVDPSGVTPHGRAFAGIDEYQQLLLEHDLDQIARNLVSQLVVFATGAEIEFADRDAVERILGKLSKRGYPIRSMIREVVASDLFRSR
ncbi:MAG: DUF1592 domain-containing protein [Gammaproteobacteria bacterium]|nr:DUF1592 domain-containing protein [Gammaproteobacteria bacterium]